MPFLIRLIAQRLLVLTFSALAFMGLDPDLSAPSPEIVQEIQERQQERIEEVFAQKPTPSPKDTQKQTPSEQKVEEVEKKITDIQKTFSQNITKPIVEKIEEKIPTTIAENKNYSTELPELVDNSFDIKKVVVNIMCLEKTSAYTKLSSGSGVVISNTGIVLTNAHVAYPLLLSEQFGNNTYSCSIRRADLPNFGYNAEVLYYPIDWLTYNSETIKDPTPIGTGENDYALLLLTSPLAFAPKPLNFTPASTNVSYADLAKNHSVTVAGYPSSNSGVFEIDTNPGLKSATTYIQDLYTFGSRSFDVLQTGVNSVAKRGSSGGGVFKDEILYGIVVTTNQSADGSYLNALSIPYIKKDFQNDTATSFDDFIKTSPDILRTRFTTSYKQTLKDIISEN